ncbi:hypothetical protein BMF94_3041 [Rhodotorula taiwanensis]|uniref:Uncharacterized protein n=1 Tax=Rhodotorula taiwanensis TaxID=741276 RepID=A0A2S5BAW6_9BASI|nr:hypothetical protein BMF94_3041 [Rhodotorula taiwanensis]
MHGLQLPRPMPREPPPATGPTASTSTAPVSVTATTSVIAGGLPHPVVKLPPKNFAEARSAARAIRGDRQKTPFVTRKSTAGKERDLSDLSVDQLATMLSRNAKLLDSPETFAKLPGGDARLRAQQRRIADRISELNAVSQIKHDLEATHLDGDEGPPPKDEDDQKPHVKKEEPDVAMDDEVLKPDEPKPAILGSTKMEEVVENGAADEATSPSAKRRIAAQILSRSPQSLTAGMTLAESIAIQQRAADRERREQDRKAARMRVAANRPQKTGELLRGALGVDSALSEYMFAADSDDSLDEADIDDYLNEGRKGVNGELNDEEDAQLNPLRTAYLEGWNRAEEEG